MVLACLAVLVLPALADSARPHLSQDPQVNQARELINRGRYRSALVILRPLAAPSRPDIIDIRFLIGLSAIAAAASESGEQQEALLDEAIAAFHAILITQPQLTRVRLELARACFLKGDDGLSQEHFERVLGGRPPPEMVTNIRRFLHVIRARRRWSGYFSVNIEQNDNLNSGTDTDVIYIFGLPFTLNDDSRPQSGNGVAFAGGGEYQYPLGRNWRWRFAADVTHSEYRGNESDQTYLALRSGPRWLLSQRSEVGLQAVVGQRWSAGSRHSNEYGLRFNARHQINRRFGVNSQASWRTTEYRISSADDINVDYTLNGTYLFLPLLQGSAGVGLSRARPDGGGGSRGRSLNLGLSRILPFGWTVGSNFSWSQSRHERDVSCVLQGRSSDPSCSLQRQVDRRRTLRLFLLNRGLTFFGFSPQLFVSREWQDSNSVFSTYQRTRWDVRLVRQF